MLEEIAADAKAVLAIGTCAAYGGIPKAYPNPTGAVGVEDLVSDKPIVNIPGCPPVPEVLSGVLVHFISFGRLPDLDDRKRPLAYFGTTIHDQCYRRPFYDQGKFAKSFDDEGARQGWCLFELGCKGPTTHNACASLKWNGGTSFPSNPVTAASAVRNRISGMRAASTPRSPAAARPAGKMPRSPPRVGLAGGAAAALCARIKTPRAVTQPDVSTPGADAMTLLAFARGPALQAAVLIMIAGICLAARRHLPVATPSAVRRADASVPGRIGGALQRS